MQGEKKRKLESLRDDILKKDNSGARTVEALDKVASLLSDLLDELRDKELAVNVPEEVTVKNLGDITPDVEVQNWPKEMNVKVSNLPVPKEIQKVEITNQPEQTDNTPFFKKLINAATKTISDTFVGLWNNGISIKQNTKKEPIYVAHVDEKGVVIGRQELQVFGGGGGGGSKIEPPTDMIGKGRLTVGMTAVKVSFTGKTKAIVISADPANSGIIFVGKSNVTFAGANALVALAAGDDIEITYNDNDNEVYVVASQAGQLYWSGALL